MKIQIKSILSYISTIILFLFSLLIFFFHVLMVDENPINISFYEFIFFILLNIAYLILQLVLNFTNNAKSSVLLINTGMIGFVFFLWILALADTIQYKRFHLYATTDILVSTICMVSILFLYLVRYKRT